MIRNNGSLGNPVSFLAINQEVVSDVEKALKVVASGSHLAHVQESERGKSADTFEARLRSAVFSEKSDGYEKELLGYIKPALNSFLDVYSSSDHFFFDFENATNPRHVAVELFRINSELVRIDFYNIIPVELQLELKKERLPQDGSYLLTPKSWLINSEEYKFKFNQFLQELNRAVGYPETTLDGILTKAVIHTQTFNMLCSFYNYIYSDEIKLTGCDEKTNSLIKDKLRGRNRETDLGSTVLDLRHLMGDVFSECFNRYINSRDVKDGRHAIHANSFLSIQTPLVQVKSGLYIGFSCSCNATYVHNGGVISDISFGTIDEIYGGHSIITQLDMTVPFDQIRKQGADIRKINEAGDTILYALKAAR